MGIPVHSLSREQKAWYANLVIAAILADDEISPSEVDFLKQVVSIVEDAATKKSLLSCISTKDKPEIKPPPDGFKKEMLAAIFMELCLIMISDLDFADSEKSFLNSVAELFSFDKSYTLEVIRWAESGLNWKKSRENLIPLESEMEKPASITNLGPEQRKWYAKALIATIMLDGVVDESELSFLKAAVSFVDNKRDQRELMGYVRNRMAPRLQNPEGIPKSTLVQIFIEIMRTMSADESLSYAEHAYLKQISDLCGFDKALFERLVEWCNQGISWMQNKTPLISACRRIEKRNTGIAVKGIAQNQDNRSIINRDFECFVCESKNKVRAFKLKPQTQIASRNIFGITTYLDSLEEQDYIDFNLIKIIVCPTCFFAASDKNLFKKNEKDKPPVWLSTKFKKEWLKDLKHRQSIFAGLGEELASIKRSRHTVLKTYQMAVKCADVIAEVSHDESIKWQAVTTMLTLSEVVMTLGNVEKAEEFLNNAKSRAEKLFKKAQNVSNSFRAARLLFYIALYFNDIQSAGPYIDFLRDYQSSKTDSLTAEELGILTKIYGETKKTLSHRSEYKKESLIGYHKNIY